jgi:hypothetical protein
MTNVANISYIIDTESYIEEHKETMPKNVYDFINQVCQDEKKYIQLVESWGNQKGILKAPEMKLL